MNNYYPNQMRIRLIHQVRVYLMTLKTDFALEYSPTFRSHLQVGRYLNIKPIYVTIPTCFFGINPNQRQNCK